MDKIIQNMKVKMAMQNMTQKTLAKKMKVDQSYISRLLNHKYQTIQLDRLYLIAEVLHCKPGELLE